MYAQVAPDYMKADLKTAKNGAKLVPDAGLGRIPGTDPTSGALPDLGSLDDGARDVSRKYHMVLIYIIYIHIYIYIYIYIYT
jgi:hypothetical protein